MPIIGGKVGRPDHATGMISQESPVPKASIPRLQILNGSLPPVCIVCGRNAPHRRFAGVIAPSLAWVLFLPILGLFLFWVSIFARSFHAPSDSAGFPFFD